jgi:hypothetical protein
MIISRKRRFIFVHIPKTGGTSLSAAYEARAAADDVLLGDTPKARQRRRRLKPMVSAGRLWKHSTLSDIRGLLSDAEIGAFFTCTIVRNPWARALSLWSWARRQGFEHPVVTAARAHDLAGFLSDLAVQESLRASPYTAYVTGPDGAERCDLFLRMEHLEDDLAALENHLGFRLGPLPRLNASRPEGEDWRAAYDPDTAALVEDLARADIARFGYAL